MKRSLSAGLAIGLLASVSIGVTATWGASQESGCWDGYSNAGTRFYGTVVPKGRSIGDCTAGSGCYWGYSPTGKRDRLYVPHQASPATACSEVSPLATTSAPTTLVVLAPTTNAPDPTTTLVVLAPTTTAPAPTTVVPTTVVPTTVAPTTTVAPPSAPAPATAAFVESFDGNTGLERFDTGVFHRDNFLVANASWMGDHDMNCGDPSTQRTIRRDRPDESFYVCREHLMTSVGDTSGYSIAWFAPKQTFHAGTHTQVSFDVNVTNLGNRQWWEVSLVPVGTPFLATVDWVANTANIDKYDRGSIVVGKGPYGNDGNIVTEGTQRDPLGWQHVCGDSAADAEGCGSKAIRRTFTITDNLNGTITFDYLGKRYTYAGAFPKDFEVYFKDHNYTPDKDGVPVGHTWHWDNIVVR